MSITSVQEFARAAAEPGLGSREAPGREEAHLSLPGSAEHLDYLRACGRDGRKLAVPVLATANDVRELLQYLKHRPHGVNTSEIAQPIKKRLFYPPKLSAYETWGLITRTGGHLTLTARGLAFAKCIEPEAFAYRSLLRTTLLFDDALRWIAEQLIEVVNGCEVVEHWRHSFAGAVATSALDRLAESAVCFFHLCQAAELGTMNIGKRGQPARLRVLRNKLQEYVQSKFPAGERIASPVNSPRTISAPRPLSIYLSCAARCRVVGQIQETLDQVGGASSEVCVRFGCGGNRASVMKRHDAGIIVISSDRLALRPNEEPLSEELLGEIGTAFVHYGPRLLLVWDRGIPFPVGLRHLRRCSFKNGTLTWKSGIELIKTVKRFAR